MPAKLRFALITLILIASFALPGLAAAAPHVQPVVGSLCLLAFDDANGNGVRDQGEPMLAGVVFTIADSAHVVLSYTTDGKSEPYCVDLLAGDYHVTMIDSPQRSATGNQSWNATVSADTASRIEYGSRLGGRPSSGGGDLGTTLYALSGIVFFVAAAAVGAYVVVRARRR